MGIKASCVGMKDVLSSIKDLHQFSKPDFIDRTLDNLADIGIDAIDEAYSMADFDNQPKDYILSKKIGENTAEIIASGETITFLEFGTGVYNNKNRDYPQADDLGMLIGEYGKGRGKNEFWFYRGVGGEPKQKRDKHGNVVGYDESVRFTRGTQASKGMLRACSRIDQNIVKVVEAEIK